VDPLQVCDPDRVGPYRLLGRLGEGGMGRVFLGASPGGRKVAIKVVHSHYANDPNFRRRFAREVAAARQVGGFHAALVVDADPDAGSPWMATAYIPGPSLADAIAQRGPLDEAGVRELGAALAEGLAAIHACGIIHRDLKPGNVILADDGPRIIDFGIAKDADASALTGSNAVIGTLRYMSPEQLDSQRVTPQSDVFALGAILAYAATGHDAFTAPGIQAIINRILNGPPDLSPLTGDLRDIISACLAKDPSHRPSPGNLLARLNPPGATSGPARTATPDPRSAPVAALAPSYAHAVEPERLAGQDPARTSTIGNGRAAAPWSPRLVKRMPEPRPEYPAVPARDTRHRRYRRVAIVVAAMTTAAAGLATLSVFQPWNHPAASRPATGRHSTVSVSATGSLAATLRQPGIGESTSVAFDPASKTLAVGTTKVNSSDTAVTGGSTYLWDTRTRKITATLTDPDSHGILSVAFAPGGTTLAISDGNGNTYLWDTSTRKIAATLTDPAGLYPSQVVFGPAATTLAVGSTKTDSTGVAVGATTYLWDTITRKITATLTDPAGRGLDSVAFAPDGTTLAVGDLNGKAYLWNTTTKKITATFTDPTKSVYIESVAFAPGGTMLAVGDSHGNTYLWNTSTRSIAAPLTDPGGEGVDSAAFAPGGTTLATGDLNGNAYLWNTTTKKITATLTDPTLRGFGSVAFGPGGTTLATGNLGGKVYLWDITYHGSS